MEAALHILVTGFSGFVGNALARLLHSKGHSVTAVVRQGSETPPGIERLVHSLGSGATLTFPPGIDAVVHLAQSRVYRSFPADADEMFSVNVVGTHELLMAAAKANVASFCLISSGTVYEPFGTILDEDAALSPTSNLGATKLAAEVLAKPYAGLFPVSILRLFAPYGVGQTARLIPDLIYRVQQGHPVTLPPSGGGMHFAPTYVDDICLAVLAGLEEGWNGIFNVASPHFLSIEEAASILGQALGKKPVFERAPISSPTIVPKLDKLANRYDLGRFRDFAQGVNALRLSQAS